MNGKEQQTVRDPWAPPHLPREGSAGRPSGDPLRIAVDFDGVLFDHIPYVLRGFRDAHGIDLESEGLRHWDYFQYQAVRDADLSWNCVRKVLRAIETDPVLHQEPPKESYARTVMERWKCQGHDVWVVTAREPISREVTELFLEHHGIPHDRLVMGANRKTGYDILIDDAPHNVLMAAAAGGLAVLMDHSYNRDVPTHLNPVRVKDWTEVERVVAAHLDEAIQAEGAATETVRTKDWTRKSRSYPTILQTMGWRR